MSPLCCCQGIIIRLCVTKTTSSRLFSHSRCSTFPRLERTALRSAIGIFRTSTRNELCPCGRCSTWTRRDLWGRWRRTYRCTRGWATSQYSHCIIVWLCVAEAATAVSFLSYNRSAAFAAVEATTGWCAVCVGSAGTGDELCAKGGRVNWDCLPLVSSLSELRKALTYQHGSET